jgi:hypothetical protein
MLSRALFRSAAPALRRSTYGPAALRTVTTDAASSHAEKEHIPNVRKSFIPPDYELE